MSLTTLCENIKKDKHYNCLILRFLLFGIIFLFFFKSHIISQNSGYIKYHEKIIEAQKSIFLEKDSIKGLKQFSEVFDDYSFVFVDDCIEAFQLALVFKQDSYALEFIEKAIENGFQIDLLGKLNLGYKKYGDSIKLEKVSIFSEFLSKFRGKLDTINTFNYLKYIESIKINKNLISFVLKRHILEQLYKQNEKKIVNHNLHAKTYRKISDENLHIIAHFFREEKYLGEKNLGIYSDHFAYNLGIPFISKLADSIRLTMRYKEKLNNIPYVTDNDYFGSNPIFLMLYHNPQSYTILKPFSEKAIESGFLHPREYATLLRNSDKTIGEYNDLFLEKYEIMPHDTKGINKRRSSMHLAPYEVDYFKYRFQRERKVQLFFGFLGIAK